MKTVGILAHSKGYSAAVFNGTGKSAIITEYTESLNSEGLLSFLKKNKNSKYFAVLSDYYSDYFINQFENAADDDFEKIIQYKIKDFTRFPANKMSLSYIIEETKNNISSVASCVSDLQIVKKLEEIMKQSDIGNYSIKPASLSLLEAFNESDFVQLVSFDGKTTAIFTSNGKIVYIREFNSEKHSGIKETFKYYGEKFNENVFSVVYSIGVTEEIPFANIKALNVKEFVKLEKDPAAAGITILAGVFSTL